MSALCTERSALCAALAERDPETLLGPLLWLLTRLARERETQPIRHDLACALAAQCTAIAAHPGVALELRLAAGGLAIEHRAQAHESQPQA